MASDPLADAINRAAFRWLDPEVDRDGRPTLPEFQAEAVRAALASGELTPADLGMERYFDTDLWRLPG